MIKPIWTKTLPPPSHHKKILSRATRKKRYHFFYSEKYDNLLFKLIYIYLILLIFFPLEPIIPNIFGSKRISRESPDEDSLQSDSTIHGPLSLKDLCIWIWQVFYVNDVMFCFWVFGEQIWTGKLQREKLSWRHLLQLKRVSQVLGWICVWCFYKKICELDMCIISRSHCIYFILINYWVNSLMKSFVKLD